MEERFLPTCEQKGEQNNLMIREAGISFSVAKCLPIFAAFLLMIIGMAVGGAEFANADWYIYCSYALQEVCLGLVVLLFLKRSKTGIKPLVGKSKWQYYLIAVLLQFGLFSLSALNGYFIQFLELFGYREMPVTLPNLSGGWLVLAIFVIGFLPAVFEELTFRGILTGGMRRSGWGTVPSILISAALFSLFHGRPEQTVYQFICGVCFALVAWRSGSILPTVLSHFLNNALVLTLSSIGVNELPMPVTIAAAPCLLLALVYLIFMDKSNAQKGKRQGEKLFWIGAIIGLFVCVCSWIVSFASGFVNG